MWTRVDMHIHTDQVSSSTVVNEMCEAIVSLLLLSVSSPLPVSAPLSFPAFVLFKVVGGVLIICFSLFFILRHSRSLIFLKRAGWGPLRVPPSLFLSLFHAFFLSLPRFYPFSCLAAPVPPFQFGRTAVTLSERLNWNCCYLWTLLCVCKRLQWKFICKFRPYRSWCWSQTL